MKKKNLTCLLTLATSLSASNASIILGTDDFTYTDGSLTSNPAWNTHSGTPGDLLVSSGAAVVQHGARSNALDPGADLLVLKNDNLWIFADDVCSQWWPRLASFLRAKQFVTAKHP